jgi:polyisoprenoid-binding protein YceI
MEDHFNENYMESTQYPKADFKGFIKNIKEINFTKDGKYPIAIEGNLTIHGVTQKVGTAGTLEIAQGKPTIIGEFSVKIKDYGIKGLYIGDKIANEAKINVNCKYQN